VSQDRYVQLKAATWDDDKFLALSAPSKVLFLWSWSHRYATLAGVYPCQLDDMVRVVGVRQVRKVLAELRDARMVLWDEQFGYLWVVNRAKHVLGTPRAEASVVRCFHRLPDMPIKTGFRRKYGRQLSL
jgi:hypothetical protein